MRKIYFLCILSFVIISSITSAQTIPYGDSQDTILIHGTKKNIFYYKPIIYDSLNSPILIGIHGQGDNGTGAKNDLRDIANKRNALIVAPNMSGLWWAGVEIVNDSCINCVAWGPLLLKEIYKHILTRERRGSVPVYLIGFSAGGQFVSRYMLIRQGIQDSIPLKMAVSANAYFYTFFTDSLNGESMWYPCGLDGDVFWVANCGDTSFVSLDFACTEHAIQYYNENYAVLIGTADTTGAPSVWQCQGAQGNNRYERARNFYNFSDTNAITRGTTLKWAFDSVAGVDHDGYAMYNTKRNVTDSSTIAETLLFDTPYHTVPQLAPIANFTADTTTVFLPAASVQFFNNSIMAATYIWDFGDGTTSTAVNPSHTYTAAGTFTVKLTATSGTGCENTLTKKYYIIVKNAVGISESHANSFSIQISPNPFEESATLSFTIPEDDYAEITLYNYMGQKVRDLFAGQVKGNTNKTLIISAMQLQQGIYFLTLRTSNDMKNIKFILKK